MLLVGGILARLLRTKHNKIFAGNFHVEIRQHAGGGSPGEGVQDVFPSFGEIGDVEQFNRKILEI